MVNFKSHKDLTGKENQLVSGCPSFREILSPKFKGCL